MSRSGLLNKAKIAKKERAVKKEKQKKVRTAVIFGLIIAIIAAVTGYFVIQQGKNETYGNAEQTVQLLANGSFRARLAHQQLTGTYSKANDGNMISFTVGDSIVTAGSLMTY